MTKGVVDGLEPIEVDQQDGTRLASALQAPDRFHEAFAQEKPVRQACERVVPGHFVGLNLGGPTRGDVLERDCPSLIGDGV